MYRPPTRKKLALTTAALAAAAAALPVTARAATTLTWDANLAQPGAQGGPGTWANGAGGWFNGTGNVTWNNANADSALFAGTAAGTVTISGTSVAQFLTFNTPGYTLAGGGVRFASLGGFNSGVHANVDVTVDAPIYTASGTDGWTKDGAGTLTLGGVSNSSAPLHIKSGTVAFANKYAVPFTVYFDGDATSRLLYAFDDPAPDVDISPNVTTTGIFDVPDASTTRFNLTGKLSGAGLFIKQGQGTLQLSSGSTSFNGSVRVDAGTLLIHDATAVNARPISLTAGSLGLQANNPTAFGSDVTVSPGAGPATLALSGTASVSFPARIHSLPSLTVKPNAAVGLTTTVGWILQVGSVTTNGTLDLNNARLNVASSLISLVGAPPGTVRFGSDPHSASVTGKVDTSRGLWFGGTTSNTFTGTFAGQADDANLQVAATSGTLILNGAWRGGGGTSTSTLGVQGPAVIGFGPNLRFNNLTADRTALRPVRLSGVQPLNTEFDFQAGFVADHSNGGATDDGLGSIELANVGWTTRSTQGLPVVVRRNPAGAAAAGTHRAGQITFDNFSEFADPTAPGTARWRVADNDQTYDGGVLIRQDGTIQLDANLTLTGRVGPYADNTVQVPAGHTLNVTGAHRTLTFAGDLGFGTNTHLNGNGALLVFDTDPGAGWLAGNYTRSPSAGTVRAPNPNLAPNLALQVGDTVTGGAIFNAPLTRLDQLSLSGTAAVSLSLPATPQKVLQIANRVVSTQPQFALDLTNNAAILNLSPNQSVDSARPLLRRGDIRSSAADADHALGYARAADVIPVPFSGIRTFLGRVVAGDDVLIRYTVLGDSDLDGVVNFNDLLRLARNYNTTANAQWSTGDFNYDDAVNFNDLLILAKHYNASLPAQPIPGASAEFSADLAAAFAAVPEPSAALTMLTACGFALSARRRRRRSFGT